MIAGIGSDLVEIDRIRTALARHGERFARRILSPAEWPDWASAHDPARLLAKRFAAKEAAAKALGTGFAQGVAFHTLEILSDAAGRPALTLHGPALARAEALGATSWHVSISHSRDTAAAVVVLEG